MSDLSIRAISPATSTSAPSSTGVSGREGTFVDSLKDAIAKVNETQLDASRTVDRFVSGEDQNVHQMMIALQKADISFQLMMQVRNKLVAAYEDIQRMQL